MTEYYTTQSLATAAAAIEQGFEGCETKDIYMRDMRWLKGFYSAPTENQWRFPRTPHNDSLMQIQLGDVVKYKHPHAASNSFRVGIVQEIIKDGNSILVSGYDYKYAPYLTPEELTIIDRNGSFPVWDKEAVCVNLKR